MQSAPPSASPSSAAAVVFDIGGVLSAPEGAVPAVAAALDLPVEVVGAAYWPSRDAYDAGGALADYWDAVGTGLGLDLSDRAAELDALDAERWARTGPEADALLAEVVPAVRERGMKLAVLSNAPASLEGVVRASAWSQPFDVLVFSAALGVAKPDPAVYEAVERALDLPGDQLVFFDDRPVNVEAARARGWRAHVWQGADGARQHLLDEGVLSG
ncbi:HAD family phosphatase [Streptomyces sp. NP160]|uniref:HAD family hydrolase n=1 Tax=Streptomyces sp. NP160 TaxID=2586637 RepID=UPI00111A366D|nr:HAD family phosphatase [Streptomyces sp. NP160]TNM59931.1 HAD family phosphatase [Streptomyces sp. NP160]